MRSIFYIFIFLLFELSLFGQEEFTPFISIGVHGGINQSTVSFDPNIRQSTTQGYSGGLIINYTAEKHFGTQFEFNFTQRGWEDKQDTLGTYSRTMDYFEIPFLTHLFFGNKLIRINFDLGPYIGFYQGLSESYTQKANALVDTVILGYRDYYGKEPAKNFDYGFIGGGGIGFFTKAGEIQLRVRYTQSLTNLFEQYPDDSFRYSYMNNMNYSIAWVYPIYLRRKEKR